MSGHGTLTTTDDGQGNCRVYVSNNGGSSSYTPGENQLALNQSGKTLSLGDVVFLEWDADAECLKITAKGTKATGTVNDDGTYFTVTSPGDTDLSGTVGIDSSSGGFGGQTNVKAANLNGEASYLS